MSNPGLHKTVSKPNGLLKLSSLINKQLLLLIKVHY